MSTQYRLLFPFELVPPKSRILLYGAGHTGKHYLKQLLMTKYCQVVGILDKSYEKYESLVLPAYPPEKVRDIEFDYIVIAMQSTTYNHEIIAFLNNLGVPKEKILYRGQREDVSYLRNGGTDEAVFERDFSLESGERSTAKTMDGVRADHLRRYEKAAEFLENAYVPPQRTFGLDCFCGTGYGSKILAEALPETNILSIDGSEEAVVFGNKYFPHEHVWRTAKVWPFALPREHFDFAVSFESIEHVPDGESLIAELASSLKPGGYFFCSVPNGKVNSLKLNKNEFHYRDWTSEEFETVLAKNMTILEKYGQDMFLFENGLKVGLRKPEEMLLKKEQEGAVLVYICQK